MKVLFSILISVSIILLNSCKPIEAKQPLTQVQVIPPTPQNKSIISIPIELDLKPFFEMGEKQVPMTFDGGEHPCEGVSFDYHFVRNPMKWDASNDVIKIDVSGKYALKMSYCYDCTDAFTEVPICTTPRIPFSCGIDEPMRRMKMQYTTQYKLTENYGIETKTELTELKAIDPCEVTVFSYDATGELIKEVRKSLTDVAKDLDKDLSKMNFRKEVQSKWNELNAPIKIENYGYLHANTNTLFLSQPSVKNNKLSTVLTVVAFPLFDNNPSKGTILPLPPLEIIEKPIDNSYSIYLDLNLDYDSLSTSIHSLSKGQVFKIKKKTVCIDSIAITGASNQELLFRVQFSGSKKGTLYLRGIPEFDAEKQVIQLKTIDFDLETKALLLKTAKWLFSNKILEEIQKASKQDIKPLLNDAKAEINKQLNYTYEDFYFSGKVDELKVLELYPLNETLMIRTKATGKLNLTNTKN
jgi:hypothetical protein